MKNSPFKVNSSFTLVEILVVISIISILVAVLLPSLQGAKDRTKRIQCLSNLRQIGLTIEYYKEDNEGYYPIRHPSPYTFFNKAALMNILGSNYMRSNWGVFSCPGNLNQLEQIGERTNGLGGRMDYEMNSGVYAMNVDGTNDFGQKVVIPSIAPVMFDFPPPNYLLGYLGGGALPPSEMPHRAQGCNIYYGDGHVAWIGMEESKASIEGRFPYYEWGRF
jgi:prepilin-type processing-associated H-X9-DG protein